MDLDACRERARQYYTDLPYHNFSHAETVLEHAEALLDRCERFDVPVNKDVVRAAVLFHDAGYHHDPETYEEPSKEQHSASIAREELKDMDIGPDTRERVAACIISTHREAPFETTEEKVVRAADLAGLASDYETFKENSMTLREEHERLHDEELTDTEWISMMRSTIEQYLTQDIRLTPEHSEDGVSRFHTAARENLERFIQEYGDTSDR